MNNNTAVTITTPTDLVTVNSGRFRVFGNRPATLSSEDYNAFTPDVIVYPNPVKNSFAINQEADSVEIYNLTGQLVGNYAAISADQVINIDYLQSGIYLVKIKTNKGLTQTKKISKEYVTDFVAKHKEFLEQYKFSFFEMTTALAFDYFAHEKVDIAIIEAGMGGRLDSTNHIDPLLSIITNISMDHKQYLGDTLEQIAYEKAGIIKSRTPVVIGERKPKTQPVFEQRAEEKLAEIHYVEDKQFPHYDSDLKGNYQEKNIKTVLTAISILQKYFTIPKQAIIDGLKHVVQNTGLQGRWQILHKHPLVICDTGHNKDGLRYVIEQIKDQIYDKLHIVLGFVKDKDLKEVLPLFPTEAQYYFVCPNIERGLDAGELKEKAAKLGLNGEKFNSVAEGYEKALHSANEKDMVFVGGSTFVVAEIL